MGILTTEDMEKKKETKVTEKIKKGVSKKEIKIIDKYRIPGTPKEAEKSFFYYNKEERNVDLEAGYVKFPKFDSESKKKEFIKMLKAVGFVDESEIEIIKDLGVERYKEYEYTLMHPDASEKQPINLSFHIKGKKIKIVDNIIKTKDKELFEYLQNKEYKLIKKEVINE